MKKFLSGVAAKVVGISVTATMAYGFYFNVEWAVNLSQVAFWMIVVISYPVMVLLLIGSVAQKDKEKAIETAKEMRSSTFKNVAGVIHSFINIVVMAISGFVWLPVIYFFTVCFVVFCRYVSVSALEETASK